MLKSFCFVRCEQGGDILGDQLRRFPLFEYLPAALPPLLFTTVLGSALALGSKKVGDPYRYLMSHANLPVRKAGILIWL